MINYEVSSQQRKLLGRIAVFLIGTMADGACLYASRRNYCKKSFIKIIARDKRSDLRIHKSITLFIQSAICGFVHSSREAVRSVKCNLFYIRYFSFLRVFVRVPHRDQAFSSARICLWVL